MFRLPSQNFAPILELTNNDVEDWWKSVTLRLHVWAYRVMSSSPCSCHYSSILLQVRDGRTDDKPARLPLPQVAVFTGLELMPLWLRKESGQQG